MPKIGEFKSEKARTTFMDAYDKVAQLWPTTVPFETLDVPTTFGATHVRRWGSGAGAPLVLLHPISGNSLAWHSFAEVLGRDRVVYALETIGTAGKSVQTAPITKGADYATWVDEVLTGLGVDRVHLFGYSEGAWHAALTGVSKSHRLASLTLGEPGAAVGKIDKSIIFRMVWLGIRPTDENFAKFNEWLNSGVSLSDAETAGAKATLGYRRRTPWQSKLSDDELAAITAPTYVFFGSETVLSDPEAGARRISTLVPNATTEIIPGGGHSVLWQMPGLVLGKIGAFIRTHDEVVA